MNFKSILPALFAGTALMTGLNAAEQAPWIPQKVIPQVVQSTNATPGRFLTIVPGKSTVIVAAECSSPETEELLQQVCSRLGVKKSAIGSAEITLSVADIGAKSDEAYKINVTPASISIVGQGTRGLAWGVQTLFQLCPPEVYKSPMSFTIPTVEIYDYPEFSYRGLHVDVSRHFFDVNTIKNVIDMLAMNKLNTLHWHLTDDQGWRIEIKKYPKLTEVGGIRNESPKPWARNQGDGKPYGPFFYTQEQIKEVIEYAALRQIEVIPEIELPGHAMAALAAYPELGCTGGPYTPWTRFGIHHDVFCAGNEKTFEVLEGILSEVAELFPSKYIHIGGDECPKDRWNKCPKCQKRMKDNNLKDGYQLQSWFITRIGKFVESKGKNIIGFDEILEGGIPPGAVVMSWRGVDGGINAAKSNHEVIMTPNSYCYFDYGQGRNKGEPEVIGGYVPLEKTYSLDVTCGLPPESAKYIKGVQANCWSEYFQTPDSLYYAILPRLSVLSETGWTPYKKRQFNEFQGRLMYNMIRYDYIGHYFRFSPPVLPEITKFEKSAMLDFGSLPAHYQIMYKIGNTPFVQYKQPVTISETCEVTYYSILTGTGRKSIESKVNFLSEKPLTPVSTQKALNAGEKQGLKCTMFKGTFKTCEEFIAKKDGKVVTSKDFSISGDGIPNNHYGLVWEGFFYAPTAGDYTFSLQSDDGSMIWINNNPAVNNDGLHDNKAVKKGSVKLLPGWHIFKAAFFDVEEAKSIKASFSTGNGAGTTLSDIHFKH